MRAVRGPGSRKAIKLVTTAFKHLTNVCQASTCSVSHKVDVDIPKLYESLRDACTLEAVPKPSLRSILAFIRFGVGHYMGVTSSLQRTCNSFVLERTRTRGRGANSLSNGYYSSIDVLTRTYLGSSLEAQKGLGPKGCTSVLVLHLPRICGSDQTSCAVTSQHACSALQGSTIQRDHGR